MQKELLIMRISTLNWGKNNEGGADSVYQMVSDEYEKGADKIF
nr:glycosyl transferase family 1 [Vibrio cholerae]